MRRPTSPGTVACFAAILFIATAATAYTQDAEPRYDDLPAVRLSYPELLDALRKVREAFLANTGPPSERGPTESVTFGRIGAAGRLEFSSLEGVEVGQLPPISNDVDYDIRDYRASGRMSLRVTLRSWLHPQVSVHGTDAGKMAAVAQSAKAALEPFAPAVLSHQERTKFGLVGLWIAISLLATIRARRGKGNARASGWGMIAAQMPMLGLILVTLGGSRLLPGVVAYAEDASWWARHESDVLLAGLALGIPGAMLVGFRLDTRSRKRRTEEANDAADRLAAGSPPAA